MVVTAHAVARPGLAVLLSLEVGLVCGTGCSTAATVAEEGVLMAAEAMRTSEVLHWLAAACVLLVLLQAAAWEGLLGVWRGPAHS